MSLDFDPQPRPRRRSSRPPIDRYTITVERVGDTWRASWDDSQRDVFGLRASEHGTSDAIPWHVVWRLVNDTRIAIERGTITTNDMRRERIVKSDEPN